MKTSRLPIIVCILLIIPSIIYSQWEWQNPSPQGNDLRGICFINSEEGWAVGWGGTILHTENGGSDWQLLHGNNDFGFKSVCFINEDEGWITGHISGDSTQRIISHTTNGGLDWEIQYTLYHNDIIAAVQFIDSNIGWAVGQNGLLLHTENGGQDWISQNGVTNQHLRDLYFINDTVGWAIGTEGLIIKTLDGGNSWTIQNSITTEHLNAIHFVDQNNGWVVGLGTILHTDDGGENWVSQNLPSYADIVDVTFINPDTGWCVSFDFDIKVLFTQDGGYSWETQELCSNCFPFCISKSFDGTLFIAGKNGDLFKTSSYGSDWMEISSGEQPHRVFSIHFTSVDVGWSVGSSGCIMKTINGGNDWDLSYSLPYQYGLNSVFFLNEFDGFIAGNNQDTGFIFKSGDGGVSWEKCYVFPDPEVYFNQVLFTDNQNGWAIGRKGVLLRTNNGGDNWEVVDIPTSQTLTSIFFIDDFTGWIVGANGVVLNSIDGGMNWDIEYFTSQPYLHCIFFLDEEIGWIGAESGYIYKTIDGGENWNLSYSGMTYYGIESIYFSNDMEGWAIGLHGRYIAYSDDGGDSWSEQIDPVQHGLLTMYFFDDTHAWIGGDFGSILFSNNGGLVNVPRNRDYIDKNEIQLFPNPVTTQLTIEIEGVTEDGEFSVYNIAGQIIKTGKITNSETTIDIGSFKAGLYIVKVGNATFAQSKKFIKY
jgi:photosystem II stability/assembly factor-like uncharacterized protein